MRNILLASAALALAVGVSAAKDTGAITVLSKVDDSCKVSIPSADVTVPSNGTESALTEFTFVCNYTGSSAEITYSSAKKGVQRGTTGPVYAYDIITGIGDDGSSTTVLKTPALSTTELVTVTNSVKFKFPASIADVAAAGDYSDILSISINP